ncbi:MAG: NAD-dependent epimerase/dehydratase family protein [Phycicoccus sp.]|nr:NAD-dependent epimerase/dehydratase family protein [Phycicoccus sp.]
MAPSVHPLVWVIGRGGLLGQSLETAFDPTGTSDLLWRPLGPIAWLAPGAGADDLHHQVGEFLREAGDRPWSVAWCAGAGVTGTSEQVLQLELAALGETLDALAAAPRGSDGAFFYASSAGGVYAGVGAPPYDESSPVCPLGAYGQAKLDAEGLVTAWSLRTGIPSLIGRIANLYGPGQNLAKAQGLISQICRSDLTGQPVSIYVSLDTLRDYFFAPDCAELIVDALARLRQEQSTTQPRGVTGLVITKILASQRAITIGAVIGEMRRLFKRAPHVVLGASPISAFQAKDLSLRSRVWPDLDRRTLTPFPVGVATTSADLLRRLQRGAVGER